jgi:hypothetical protein
MRPSLHKVVLMTSAVVVHLYSELESILSLPINLANVAALHLFIAYLLLVIGFLKMGLF